MSNFNSKKNTFIFITNWGNYHITEGADQARAFKLLVKEKPAWEDNIAHCLEIKGTHQPIIDHDTDA